MSFRHRGVPSLDSLTAEIVGHFRVGVGYNRQVENLIRKFLPVQVDHAHCCHDHVDDRTGDLERGHTNTVDAQAKEKYSRELDVIDAMSATSHATSAVSRN